MPLLTSSVPNEKKDYSDLRTYFMQYERTMDLLKTNE